MFPANLFVIRPATKDDEFALRRLAEMTSRTPLTGRVLVGEIDGAVATGISLTDDRVVADPLKPTALLVVVLRMRADALRAYEAEPSLSKRIAASLARPPHRSLPAAA